jgi:hypothetical protein
MDTTTHRPTRPHATVVRLATPEDGDALALVSALDGRPLGGSPLLVAETDGRIVAALSLTDGIAVSDPFRFTLEEIALLREHADRLDSARAGDTTRSGRRTLRAALARGAAVGSLAVAILVGASTAEAAPKPGLQAGTWIGSGQAQGTSTEAGMSSTFSARLRFTIVVGKDGRVRGTGAFASDMTVTGEFPSVVSSTATLAFGGTPTRLLYTGTAATRATFDTVTRDLKPIALRVRLPIGRAGACRASGSVVLSGFTFTWSAVRKVAGTCRT